jgi:hypothetical protein
LFFRRETCGGRYGTDLKFKSAQTESRERGTVLSWKDAKGHGRIKSDAGDVLWAHFAFIDQEEVA